jgi:hypothetical protein
MTDHMLRKVTNPLDRTYRLDTLRGTRARSARSFRQARAAHRASEVDVRTRTFPGEQTVGHLLAYDAIQP